MFDLTLTDEERSIQESLREFLAKELPLLRLTAEDRGGSPFDQVTALAGLGWLGVGQPQDLGGAGLGVIGEVLLLRECGSQLVTPTLFATIMAGHVAQACGQTDFAARTAAGDIAVALAISGPGAGEVLIFDWDGESPVLVMHGDELALYWADAVGHLAARPCLDDSLSMACGPIASASAGLLAATRDPLILAQAELLQAAYLVGIAHQAAAMTLDYVNVRTQFGEPVGSFQAVKHRCADMALQWRLAWCQAGHAARSFDRERSSAAFHAAAAKIVAAEAAQENSRTAIQLHGGIGFQAASPLHWLVKRAHVFEQAGKSRLELSHDLARMNALVPAC